MKTMARASHNSPPSVLAGGPSDRDPTLALYDQACDLLAAAQGLRAAAAADGVTPAIAATLGGVEATLDLLADSVQELRRQAVKRLELVDEPSFDRVARVRPAYAERQFDELTCLLRASCDATAETCDRIGPSLAEPSEA